MTRPGSAPQSAATSTALSGAAAARLTPLAIAALGVAALLAGAAQLAAAALAGEGLAFPLDDAWIHQTYARNLAWRGEWAFVPGQPSAGSTAPLWTLALAAGYALRLDGVGWAHALGIALLALSGLLAGRLAGALFPGRPLLVPAVMLLTAGEWHLAWASASGMETLLFVALSLALLEQALTAPPRAGRAVLLGLLGGLLSLTRPEGIVLFGLVLAARAAGSGAAERAADPDWRARLGPALLAGLVFALLVLPLVAFNLRANGTPFPNTFTAKQVEYQALLAQPLPWRLARLLGAILLGPLALLLPGLIAVLAGRPRPAGGLAGYLPLIWCGLFLGLYAWRLPVTYQHARYVLPAIPLVIVYGLAGLAGLYERGLPRGRAAGLLGRLALALLLAVPPAFLIIGAQAYGADVRLINREPVAAARWIAANTPAGALIAAHDVGALGYFAGRPLVDLAGLVAPEVIPVLGDPAALADHVRERQADYLMQGLGFDYPALRDAPGVTRVYTTAPLWPAEADHGHVEVYRLR